MTKSEHYMNLPYDLSGSISKNRFRNELLWGLKKILDLHKCDKDYTVVFDYCCDIEVHLEDNLEFYQIKTQNNNGTYTINKLISIDKSGNSVLGKLYILKYDENKAENNDIVVALVSNAPLSDSRKTYADCECISIDSIEKESIEKIKKKIKNELNLNQDINIINTFFIRTGIDLAQPDKSLIGELVVFFDEVFKEDVKKVRSLYRILLSKITDKACYEMKISEYDDILKKKGISRESFDNILKQYIDKTDIAVEKTKDFINNLYANRFKKRIDMNKSLNRVFLELINNKVMQKMERKVVEYITENIDNLPSEDIEIIKEVYKHIIDDKPIEMDDYDVKTLIILSLKRFEEGVYEEFNI
ncbi:dsDNA nuclease domain-containing protein [Clostridium butyricum]